MAFFSTPEVPWLYSGVTMTKPSNEAIFVRPLLGVLVLVLAERRRQRLVEVRQRVVAQVDELELGVVAARGDVEHPAGDLLAVAVGRVLPRMMPMGGVTFAPVKVKVGPRGPGRGRAVAPGKRQSDPCVAPNLCRIR